MEQERFRYIFEKYHILRKIKAEFPPRNIEQKNMIQFSGIKSPILDNLDEFVRNKFTIILKLGRDLIEQNKKQVKKWL